MFELAHHHERDDLEVRDRALRAWVAENGQGLPLYIALVARRLRDEMTAGFEAQNARIERELDARHPIWSRVRRVRHRLRRADDVSGPPPQAGSVE